MSDPAKKLEASGKYDVSLVTPDKLMMVWEDVEKHLKKSCKRSKNRTKTQDIFYECLNNQSSLWIVFDTGNLNIVGCGITQFNDYPTGKKMLNLDHVAGIKYADWVDRSLEVIEKWARDNECNGIETAGREGFWHWIKERQWERTAVFFEYNFEDIA
tara:strand:+ start:52 stop:522 length:471 start_codon:yes stop_codon:yes gene_type:complete